jgi:hypothetical protein
MNKHSQLYLFAKGHFDEKAEELGISKDNALKLIVLNDLVSNNFIASFNSIDESRIYFLLFDVIEEYLETNNCTHTYYSVKLRRWIAEEYAKKCLLGNQNEHKDMHEYLNNFHLYLLRFATRDELNKGGTISTEPDFTILSLWKKSKEEIEKFLATGGFEFIFIAAPLILKVKKEYGVTLNSGKFNTSEIIEKIYKEQTMER